MVLTLFKHQHTASNCDTVDTVKTVYTVDPVDTESGDSDDEIGHKWTLKKQRYLKHFQRYVAKEEGIDASELAEHWQSTVSQDVNRETLAKHAKEFFAMKEAKSTAKGNVRKYIMNEIRSAVKAKMAEVFKKEVSVVVVKKVVDAKKHEALTKDKEVMLRQFQAMVAEENGIDVRELRKYWTATVNEVRNKEALERDGNEFLRRKEMQTAGKKSQKQMMSRARGALESQMPHIFSKEPAQIKKTAPAIQIVMKEVEDFSPEELSKEKERYAQQFKKFVAKSDMLNLKALEQYWTATVRDERNKSSLEDHVVQFFKHKQAISKAASTFGAMANRMRSALIAHKIPIPDDLSTSISNEFAAHKTGERLKNIRFMREPAPTRNSLRVQRTAENKVNREKEFCKQIETIDKTVKVVLIRSERQHSGDTPSVHEESLPEDARKICKKFKRVVCAISNIDMEELDVNWEWTVSAKENETSFLYLAQWFIDSQYIERKHISTIGHKLGRIRFALKSIGVPVSNVTDTFVTGELISYERQKKSVDLEKEVSKLEIKLPEMLQWLATTTGTEIIDLVRSELLDREVEKKWAGKKCILVTLKNLNAEWIDKCRFMVRAILSLSSLCGLQTSELWDLKINSFSPSTVSAEALCVLFNRRNQFRILVAVPFKDVRIDPTLCLAQYLSVLDESERTYPFRFGVEQHLWVKSPNFPRMTLNIISMFASLSALQINPQCNSITRPLRLARCFWRKLLSRYNLSNQDISPLIETGPEEDLQEVLAEKTARLCSLKYPYMIADRLEHTNGDENQYEITENPHWELWQNLMHSQSSVPWFDRLTIASLRLEPFQALEAKLEIGMIFPNLLKRILQLRNVEKFCLLQTYPRRKRSRSETSDSNTSVDTPPPKKRKKKDKKEKKSKKKKKKKKKTKKSKKDI